MNSIPSRASNSQQSFSSGGLQLNPLLIVENSPDGNQVSIRRRDQDVMEHFSKMLADLHKGRLLPDVSIVCGGEISKAHQLVLAMNSGFFRKSFQEAPSKHPIILLKDVRPDMINFILEFLYTGKVALAKSQINDFVKTANDLEIYWDLTNRPTGKLTE